MEHSHWSEELLPQTLMDEVEAVAIAQNRSASEVLKAAVEAYVREHRPPEDAEPKRTPQEAAARMLARRPFHKLPDGTTIRDLMTYGRA